MDPPNRNPIPPLWALTKLPPPPPSPSSLYTWAFASLSLSLTHTHAHTHMAASASTPQGVAERRGIPAAAFVEDVEAYLRQAGLDVNSALAFLQER